MVASLGGVDQHYLQTYSQTICKENPFFKSGNQKMDISTKISVYIILRSLITFLYSRISEKLKLVLVNITNGLHKIKISNKRMDPTHPLQPLL